MTLTAFIFQFVHGIYMWLPFKKEICWFLRNFTFFKSKIYKDFRFKGKFKLALDNQKSIYLYHYFHTSLENELFWKGLQGWEYHSVKTWQKLCVGAEVIIDIGANTGIYSLLAKKSMNAKVYAFEPSDKTFRKLQKNIQMNSLDIEAFQIALSNNTGTATFYDFDAAHQYSASLNKSMSEDRAELISRNYQVKTQRLDAFIEEKEIRKIDLIKLDVEKHEPEVIEGLGEYLQKYKPSFIVEVLDNNIGFQLENLFFKYDYQYYAVDELKGLVNISNLQNGYYRNYLVCQKEVAERIDLK